MENLKRFNFIGVRVLTDDEDYNIGDTCRNSYDWDYENDISCYETDGTELNGTCAIDTEIDTTWDSKEEIEEKILNAINFIKSNYWNSKIVVIGGNNVEYGQDPKEIIIEDAEVIRLA